MITVVTVCLNAGTVIEKTMKTVITQVDTEIEYIIKDGGSEDDTEQIVNKIIDECTNDKITFDYIVLKDSGIYDAMNQAIERAHGEWIIFMNAGDVFWDSYVLRDASAYMSTAVDVLYGNTVYTMNCGYNFPQIHNVSTIRNQFNLGHQSCLIRVDIIRKYPFNTQYKIAGDYEQLRRLFVDEKKFVHMNLFVSVCNRDGISCQKSDLQFDEIYKIQHDGVLIKNFPYKRELIAWRIKRRLAKMFPKWEGSRYCLNNIKRIHIEYECF